MKVIFLSVLTTVLCFSLGDAQGNVTFSDDDPLLQAFFQAVDDELMNETVRGAAYAFRGPGMTAPVMKGYGRTGASRDSPLVDPDTAFLLASISKTYTGAAVAVLVDQGLIDLDDDICEVFGGVTSSACRNPYFPDSVVTWRMMVTHRSSINRDIPTLPNGLNAAYGPSSNENVGAVGNPRCPLNDTQQFFEDLFVDKDTETIIGNQEGSSVKWYDLAEEAMGGVWNSSYAPGEENAYSNIAVGYLASLVERISGEPFPEFCKKYIFDVVGMNHTAWFLRDLPEGTTISMPQISNQAGTRFRDAGHYCFADYASGQLHSSVRDMSYYADALLDYGVGTFWSSETAFQEVFGCQEKDEQGSFLPEDECQMSLAWFYLNKDKQPINGTLSMLNFTNGLYHAGAETGVSTEMTVLPEAKAYVIVLTNSEDAYTDYTRIIFEYGMEYLRYAAGEDVAWDDDVPDTAVERNGNDDFRRQ